jgi:hypothetical protein
MNNVKTGNNGKAFNPTVTVFFDSPKWAGKAFSGEDNAAYLSAVLDDKAIKEIQSLREGNKLLLRKSSKLNKNGGFTYYMEVIRPQDGTYKKTATEQVEEGI